MKIYFPFLAVDRIVQYLYNIYIFVCSFFKSECSTFLRVVVNIISLFFVHKSHIVATKPHTRAKIEMSLNRMLYNVLNN